MLRHLFPRLTPAQSRGSALFEALVAEARREHWFVEGGVPDTIDGRSAGLGTVARPPRACGVRVAGGGGWGRALFRGGGGPRSHRRPLRGAGDDRRACNGAAG